MIKNTKVFSALTIFFWSTLIIEIALIELSNINIITMLVPLIVSSIGTITLLIIFEVSHRKAKPKVNSLKNEYLESIKPKQPLRFCASDDELLKAYKSSAHEVSTQQSIKQTNITNNANNTKTEKTNDNDEITM